MPDPRIHPTAVVSQKAKVADDVEIGPFAVVEDDVEIGAGSKLASHVVLKSGCRIWDKVRIENFAVIGGDPQDYKFSSKTRSYVEIGEGSWIREGVTVHRSTAEDGATTVGKNCFLMAYSHVAHDCYLEDNVVMANGVLLAGHIEVGAGAFLGGGAVFHQFIRIGRGSIVSGNAQISYDVPPFVTAAERNTVFGLNLIGLKRRNVLPENIRKLREAYKAVYFTTGSPQKNAAAYLEQTQNPSAEAREFLEFFSTGKRGLFCGSRRTRKRSDGES